MAFVVVVTGCSGASDATGSSPTTAAGASSSSSASATTTTPPVCDAGLLWEAARVPLKLDPKDPGYSQGPTPGVLAQRCVGAWARGCASRPVTGCTDIFDVWHWTNGNWQYVDNYGVPPLSCLMRDKGGSEEAIAAFFSTDDLRDFNMCAYPPPADVQALIKQENALDMRCRGTGNDPAACDQRNVLYQQIVSLGWCFDDVNAMVAAYHWHRCGESSQPWSWDRYNSWARSLA